MVLPLASVPGSSVMALVLLVGAGREVPRGADNPAVRADYEVTTTRQGHGLLPLPQRRRTMRIAMLIWSLLVALAILAIPFTAQEPEPPVNDDVATFRAVLAEQVTPLRETMEQMLRIMAEDEKQIAALTTEVKKLEEKKPCQK
jgi:hypothetical protein